jgi:hypothetical protein
MLINYCMFLALPDVFSSSYTQFQKVESFGGNTNTILYLDSLSLSLSLSLSPTQKNSHAPFSLSMIIFN